MKKILLIGPLSPPITGNSIANDIIIKGLNKNKLTRIDYINTQFDVFKSEIGKFNLKKALFSIKKYFKLYKVFKCDIVYITPGQTFLGVLKYAPFIYLAKFINKKVVIHIHGNFLEKQYNMLSGLKKNIFRTILKKADKGIVLSKSLLSNLTHFLPNKNIYIISNFVEDYLRPLDFKVEENERLKIFFLSNLMDEKGVVDLIHALVALKKMKIPFEARFAGNIEEKLRPIIKPFFNIEGINYLGAIKGKQKKELLEWGNVFVLPTYYKMEGLPISILEAMATGSIILTTKHAGIPDIVSEKNGFFVNPNSPEDIKDKLIYIQSRLNQLKEMRYINIKESKIYTEENFVNKLLDIFNS